MVWVLLHRGHGRRVSGGKRASRMAARICNSACLVVEVGLPVASVEDDAG